MNPRRFRSWLLASVLLSITSFGVAEREFGQLVFALILAAAGWWVTERSMAADWAGLPRWLANIVLILVLLFSSIRIYNGTEPVSAFGLFLTSIIIIKLWERRLTTDYGQILTLSTFLTIGASLNDNSLALGLVLFGSLPVLVITVLLYQIAATRSRARAALPPVVAQAPAIPTPAASLDPHRDHVAWRSLRRTGVVAILAGIAIAIPVFLIVPRGIGSAAFGSLARPSLGRATGFSDSVNLGSGGTITESQTQVMEVRVTSDVDNKDIGGSGRAYYFRGAILDRYDRGRWVRSERIDTSNTITLRREPQRIYHRYRQERPETFFNQSITIWRAPGDSPLFSAWRTVQIASETPGNARIDEDGRLTRLGEPGVVSYELRSRPDPFPNEPTWDRPIVDPVSPVIARHAAEVLKRTNIEPDPTLRPVDQDAAAVRSFENYLRSNFEYSLSPNPAPIGQDPTEWFLTLERKGHCEYFASSLALMCRAVGIPARVVTGYLALEYDESGHKYIVRESNAHAWVEAWLGPEQWREYDGTPPAWISEHHGPPKTLAARLWRTLDRVDNAWNGTIVTFDDRARSRLLGNSFIPSSWVRDGGLYGTLRDAEPRRAFRSVANILTLALQLTLLASAVTAIFWALRVWRRSHPNRRAGWALDPRSPEGIAYERLLRELERRKVHKPDWLPLREFLSTLPPNDPIAPSALLAATLINHARFGQTPLDIQAFNRALNQLRAIPTRMRT